METVDKGDIPWSQFYVGLSVVALGGSITIASGIFEWISSSQWMLFTSGLFMFSSIAHMRHVRKL